MSEFTSFVSNLNRDRYMRLFNRIREEKIPCAFFVPMIDFQSQISFLEQLKNLGFNVQYFFTLDENLTDSLSGIPTVYIKNLQSVNPKPKYVLAVDSISNHFVNKFKDAGFEVVNLLTDSGDTDAIFNFYMDHLEDLEEVYSLLDEESRRVFLGYISAKISNRFTDFVFDSMPQYLLNGYMPKPNDVVICAGACDGSTAAMFSDLKCRVIAFEMDSENYELSKKSAAEKNFTLENFGLGSYNHKINYVHLANHIGGSHISRDNDQNSLTAEIISIDEYAREKNLESVDFIQLDTEGEELEILKGAVVTITRFKPILAVSAYHKPEDIFVLAQFIKSIRPDYEFAFRHYGIDIRFGSSRNDEPLHNFFREYDLPMMAYSYGESVLYAR